MCPVPTHSWPGEPPKGAQGSEQGDKEKGKEARQAGGTHLPPLSPSFADSHMALPVTQVLLSAL